VGDGLLPASPARAARLAPSLILLPRSTHLPEACKALLSQNQSESLLASCGFKGACSKALVFAVGRDGRFRRERREALSGSRRSLRIDLRRSADALKGALYLACRVAYDRAHSRRVRLYRILSVPADFSCAASALRETVARPAPHAAGPPRRVSPRWVP
jgi:hypothetical protein